MIGSVFHAGTTLTTPGVNSMCKTSPDARCSL
jgi:hypothetical protein